MNPLITEIVQLLRTANLGLLREALNDFASQGLLHDLRNLLIHAQPKPKKKS